jgi:hypothetical protein
MSTAASCARRPGTLTPATSAYCSEQNSSQQQRLLQQQQQQQQGQLQQLQLLLQGPSPAAT